MEPSIQIGRMFKISIRMHVSFIFLVFYALRDAEPLTAIRGVNALFLLLVLFGCVLLHELGHALVARWCGINTPAITLSGLGGMAHLERPPDRPLHDLLIAIAGPVVSLGIAIAAFILALGIQLGLALAGYAPLPASLIGLYDQLSAVNTLVYIGVVNLILLLFNLLPGLPLDGGRALRALLAMVLHINTVNKIMKVLSRVIAMIVLALGIVLFDIALIILAALMFVLAETPVTYRTARGRV